MKLRKFENVNVIETLEKIVKHNTESYQTDFRYDIEKLEKAADYSKGCHNFLWLSRKNGTECFEEKDVYIQNTHALNSWGYYTNSDENVKAFAIQIDREDRIYNDGIVKGNIYELDYKAHVEETRKNNFHAMSVEVDFKDPYYQRTFEISEYNDNWHSITQRYGQADKVTFLVADPHALQMVIAEAWGKRGAEIYESANIDDYVVNIVKQRFHDFGYTNDDMVFTTPTDVYNAVKLSVPAYALLSDNICEKLENAEHIAKHNMRSSIFGMTEQNKSMLDYLAQDPKKAVSLFTDDELKAILATAIETGKTNNFDAPMQKLVDSIIFKAETALFGGVEPDLLHEVEQESELER